MAFGSKLYDMILDGGGGDDQLLQSADPKLDAFKKITGEIEQATAQHEAYIDKKLGVQPMVIPPEKEDYYKNEGAADLNVIREIHDLNRKKAITRFHNTDLLSTQAQLEKRKLSPAALEALHEDIAKQQLPVEKAAERYNQLVTDSRTRVDNLIHNVTHEGRTKLLEPGEQPDFY